MHDTPHEAPPVAVARARHARQPRVWRFSAFMLVPVVLALLGLGVLLYPSAAAWVSALNSSRVITEYQSNLTEVDPSPSEQLAQAHRYNELLSSGAIVEANANVPRSEQSSDVGGMRYSELLRASDDGVMGRVLIPAIDVDLPIYHGTDEETLRRGAGHLRGTSLPVGGTSTHSVVTAHRGLPEATLFDRLDELAVGDVFSFDVMGEVFSYRVVATRVVEPDETEQIRLSPGADLATLVTCTPLGINSHRILVTGERIIPTPVAEMNRAQSVQGLGFPWWAVWFGSGLLGVGVYVRLAGLSGPVSAGEPEPRHALTRKLTIR